MRTISAVDRPDACGKPGEVFDKKQPATFIKNVGCNPGEFPDIGWCWTCPSGSNRDIAHIESDRACVVPARTESRAATFIAEAPMEACGSEGQGGCSIGSRRRGKLGDIPCERQLVEIGGRCVQCGREGQPGCPIASPRRAELVDRPCEAQLVEIGSRCVQCGATGQPGCPILSPRRAALGDNACETGLAEANGTCVPCGGFIENGTCVSCGSEGQRGCPVLTPRRAALGDKACETGLAESNGKCVRCTGFIEAGACVKCGAEGERGCPVLSPRRVALGDQPCESQFAEIGGKCVKCGAEGQPGCPVFSARRAAFGDRPCESPLEEVKGRCKKPPPDTPCGDVGQRACCAGERSFGTCSAGRSTVAGCPYGKANCRCGKGSVFLASDHCEAECSVGSDWKVTPKASCGEYKMGLATRDITGPVVDTQMQGYANGFQRSMGLQTRLWARAFVVEGCNGKRVAFVSADLAQMFHSVRQGVVDSLKQKLGDTYGFDNVVISATHTHAAIQGYSHNVWMNLSGVFDSSDRQGFDRDNFDAIVGGITDAIVAADAQANSTTGSIRVGTGNVDKKASFNRSKSAYDLNPQAEREGQAEVDRLMTLLRFDASDGRELGSFNWFPVHNTTYSRANPFVSGDAKEIAAYWLEQEKGVKEWGTQGGYVAGFAQANCGDVSPNLPKNPGDPNPPTSTTDKAHSRTIPNAIAQLDAAKAILAKTTEQVKGSVEVINSFVDFENVWVEPAYTNKLVPAKTCEAWYGAVFQAGSKEDGEGSTAIREGAKVTGIGFGGKFIPFVGLPAAVNSLCHEKELHPIVVLGKRADVYWSPTKLPLQLVVIGQVAIAAVPFELTTMTGRRLKKTLLDSLGPRVKHVVIAGLANDYAGYVTTREEHTAVHYEGASTQFGPDTEAALRQEFTALSCSLKGGSSASKKAWRNSTPPDLRTSNVDGPSNPASLAFAKGSRAQPVMSKIQPDFFDSKRKQEAIVTQVKSSYKLSDTVVFKYRGGHPRRSVRKLPTFFKIERQDDKNKKQWQTVATDTSPETRFIWEPTEIQKATTSKGPQYHSELRIEWLLSIPGSSYKAKPGTYRIRFFGHTDTGKGLKSYDGISSEFTVEK